MARELFTPKEFLAEIHKECQRKKLDKERVDARLLLYLVEKGVLYPVRTRAKDYELKKYTQVDYKVMQLLLRDIAGPQDGRRNIIKSVLDLAEKIKEKNLIDKLKKLDDDGQSDIKKNNERLLLREAYKRIVARVSELGYEGRDKTNILGMRRGDHNILFVPNKEKRVTKYLFHEIVSRILQSLKNEICILITTGDRNKILMGLQRRGAGLEKIRHLFILHPQQFIEDIKKTSSKTDRKKPSEKLLPYLISSYVRSEALSKGIKCDDIKHIWMVNEANSDFYDAWFEEPDYIESEDKLKLYMNEALGKHSTLICVYERDLLLHCIKEKGQDPLLETAEIIGIHKRIYALDETLVTGTQAMSVIMKWIANYRNEKL